MATLKDIAQNLGLSVTQVSRALNGHSDVNEATRLRVQDAAKALNYQPNMSARKLVSGRSGMVGLVVPNHPGLPSDQLFVEVVAGLSAQFSNRDMQFVLHIADAGRDILTVYQKLINGGALDGFVLTSPQNNDPRIDFLTALGVPFVLHGRTMPAPPYPYFDIDNRRLACNSTRHLIDHGHRHIALINGQADYSYVTARQDGYLSALSDAGIPPDPALHSNGPMDVASGLVATIRLMAQTPRPTAIICGNLLIAKGVYDALASLGLSIPSDVSVIAHDDLLPGLHGSAFFPPLTVTKSPLRDSWQPLADFLIGALEGRPLPDLQRVADYAFIPRASVAAPNH